MSIPNPNQPTAGAPAPSPLPGSRLDVTAGDIASLDTLAIDMSALEAEDDTVVLRAPVRAAGLGAMPPPAPPWRHPVVDIALSPIEPRPDRASDSSAAGPTPLRAVPADLHAPATAARLPARPGPAPAARPPAATPAAPSAAAARSAGSRLPPMPFIGGLAVPVQQRVLAVLIVLGLVGLVSLTGYTLNLANRLATQSVQGSLALMHSQRLAMAAVLAMSGSNAAFDQLQQSADALGRSVRGLRSGNEVTTPVAPALQEQLVAVLPMVERAEKQAAVLLGERARVVQLVQLVGEIGRRSADLLETTEAVTTLKLQQAAPGAEVAAAGQLSMLSQRIPKSADSLLTTDGISREALLLLGKDLSVFGDLVGALINGNADLRLAPPRNPVVLERLQTLQRQFEGLRAPATQLLNSLQAVGAARAAQAAILADSEGLRQGLEGLSQQLANESSFTTAGLAMVALAALLLVLGVLGLVRLYVAQQQDRAALAEAQRQRAEAEQADARRSNDATQAAILQLMNELEAVGEGDLTQQATVTEEITGAIADSINYTVEELRRLVAQVQGTATRVTETTEQVEATSIDLLAASSEQLREIRDTGESVLQMAGRINQVSAQAQQTVHVAQQSLAAAGSGLKAVQDTIGGMNTIRDQIQDTSKRIKRLGESSQEIGEITELISDITEQTNVLALNAAIQAASAGEAGRGFSVVAEEVQRLAERSADATRQIAALVRTIQADAQDAVGAMERSTQGVVEGARLSDAAGTALGDIDRVTNRLSELIADISQRALREAESANLVAGNIQHIFAVTEQTGEGTRSTAHMVRELSQTADELRTSVARFKIA
jgi:twitching motility protein PilJ